MTASPHAAIPEAGTPPLDRMRAALSEIAANDAVLGPDAAALELVQLPDESHAVLMMNEDIRFNATLTRNMSHGELVRMLTSGLTLLRLQGDAGSAAVPPGAP